MRAESSIFGAIFQELLDFDFQRFHEAAIGPQQPSRFKVDGSQEASLNEVPLSFATLKGVQACSEKGLGGRLHFLASENP